MGEVKVPSVSCTVHLARAGTSSRGCNDSIVAAVNPIATPDV